MDWSVIVAFSGHTYFRSRKLLVLNCHAAKFSAFCLIAFRIKNNLGKKKLSFDMFDILLLPD